MVAILDRLADLYAPLASWTGYSSVVLVSSSCIKPWTVAITNPDRTSKALLLPRRWFNIWGKRMNDVWEAALRAVMGLILFRPGISQVCYIQRDGCSITEVAHRPKFAGDSDRSLIVKISTTYCNTSMKRISSQEGWVQGLRSCGRDHQMIKKRGTYSGYWTIAGGGINCHRHRRC